MVTKTSPARYKCSATACGGDLTCLKGIKDKAQGFAPRATGRGPVSPQGFRNMARGATPYVSDKSAERDCALKTVQVVSFVNHNNL